jgi:Arc/MetJ family transcription regulator
VYDLRISYTFKGLSMRTNIDIDDKLMDDVMATGDFKTKREAVEAGLQLIKRRKAYAAIRAARGTLFWDDSDEAWARSRAELEAQASQNKVPTAAVAEDAAELAVHETAAAYAVASPKEGASKLPKLPKSSTRGRRKVAPEAAS